ncbi:hypothetical protein GS415_00660 [Rhodococcus hoagii]|nr:hypothetical protein [Prescottella equi]
MRALTGRMSRREAILMFAQGRLDELLRRVDPWDGNSVQEFADAAAQIAIAAQQQAVSLATATQTAYLKELGLDFEFVPQVPDEVRLFSDRSSKYAKPKSVRVGKVKQDRLSAEEIFNRPAREYRGNVSSGMDEAKALAISENRARILVETNVALAEREATHQILGEASKSSKKKSKSPKIVGYRRVIHPEASKGGVCGLCLAASDRMYFVDELKPIHDHCQCETIPATADFDPGRELNEQDLSSLYDTAGGTAAKQLKQVRFKIDEHGELGPVLVPARKRETIPHFTYMEPNALDPVDLDAFQREREMVPA